MDELEETMRTYFRHLVGMGGFFRFLSLSEKMSLGYSAKENIVTLDDALSKKFILGFPKKKGSGERPPPFVGFPVEEESWGKNIVWKKAVVRKGDRRVYLVSEYIEGDGELYPDIPQFAVAITTDTTDKAETVSRFGTLEGRTFWFDDMKEIGVNMHNSFFTIPLVVTDSKTPVFGKDDKTTAKSLQELMREKSLREDRATYPAY